MLKSKKPRESIPIAIFSLQLSFFFKKWRKNSIFSTKSPEQQYTLLLYIRSTANTKTYMGVQEKHAFSLLSLADIWHFVRLALILPL